MNDSEGIEPPESFRTVEDAGPYNNKNKRMMNNKRIVALGFFDGVHLGHQALLRECVRLAAELDCPAAAITFDKHPMSLFTAQVPPLINSCGDRELLLRHYGIGTIYELPVTKEVMSTDWRSFLENMLKKGAAGFVCGDDFRFGAKGAGDGEKLSAFCRERGLPCVIVPEQTLEGTRISSTYIRRQIEEGDMATAVRFLGHPHILTGQVVHGQRIGRTLGIPTANLRLPEGVAVPKFGVYVCRCLVEGQWYPAVTNVGTRPTVEGSGITVEAWILDYTGDLYDKTITLEFHRFLREERKFFSLEALKAQIQKDARETREFLKR